MSRGRRVLALASLPVLLLAGATAASAQSAPGGRPCSDKNGNYTNGVENNQAPYELRRSPTGVKGAGRNGETAVRVRRGAELELGARLLRNQKPCPGERVGFYTRQAGRSQYVLIRQTNPTTAADGLINASTIVNRDLRFFANYNTGPTTLGARTPTTLVQTR